MSFALFVSSPTDENVFRDLEARLVTVRPVPAEQMDRKKLEGAVWGGDRLSSDSLFTGDLITGINGSTVATVKDANELIASAPGSTVTVDIVRPSQNYRMSYRVPRDSIEQDFIALLPRYVYVSDITPRGASDRAGMKVGDLIVRINDREFGTAQEADRILREGTIGRSLTYIVLRGNRYIELNVVLATFGIRIAILLFVISGVVVMLAGLFIAASRPQFLAARLLGAGFLLIGFAMATAVIRRGFDPSLFEYVRTLLLVAGTTFGPALLLHAGSYFPAERPELIGRRWLARSYYIAAAAACGLIVGLNQNIALLLVPLVGAFVLFRYRREASAEFKRLNRMNRWTGIAVGAASTVVTLFFNGDGVIGFGIYGVLLALIPVSYLYTIGRYRLLDFDLRVRRNTQYTLITMLWNAAAVYLFIWCFFELPRMAMPSLTLVFTGASIELSDTPVSAEAQQDSEHIMLMAAALAVTFVLLRVRKWGQSFLDRKYFRTRYDYRAAQQELGELLSTTQSMQELAKAFVRKLSGLIRLKSAGVLFFRDERCCTCEEAYGFDGTSWREFCVQHEELLITAVKQFRNEIRVQYLPSPVKERFQAEGFQYLVPVRSKERLIGVILVGEKQAETTFQQEDLSFLASAARQASVAIENAFLYEQLAEKERMKHELEIARKIQLDSLPQRTPDIPGLDIAGTSVPAMEVGGDFFDYLTNGSSKLTVVIGDVSGKGTSAALYMSKVQGILRSLHGFELRPKQLFERANRLLCQDLEKRSFVTVLGGEFDPAARTLVVARAGHLPLWHYDAASRTVRTVVPRGIGLGLNDAGVFTAEMEERTIGFSPGDVFLFATDGVTDAHTDGREFGEERVVRLLADHADRSAADIRQALLDAVRDHVGSSMQHDDETVVVVKAV